MSVKPACATQTKHSSPQCSLLRDEIALTGPRLGPAAAERAVRGQTWARKSPRMSLSV